MTGLTDGTTYNVTYTSSVNGVNTVSLTADGTGTVIVGNLSAGTYSAISVETTGCDSNVVGPITLNDPTSITTFDATTTDATCTGNGSVTLSGLAPNTTYDLYFNNGQGPIQITTDAAGTQTFNNIAPNTFTNLYVEGPDACQSNVVPSITIGNAPTITIAVGTFTDPTTCNGNDGTITLTGLAANTNYVVTVDGVSQTFTSDFAGMVTITDLSAGTYNSITVSADGCDSNTVGPVTLTDPTALPIALNAPTCDGEDGVIEITGLTAFTTYVVAYDFNDGTSTTTVNAGSFQTNGIGVITLDLLADGTYGNGVVEDANGLSLIHI